MLIRSTLKSVLFLFIALFGAMTHPNRVLAADEDTGYSAEERQSLEEAKSPEQRLKAYLGIAEPRLKTLIASVRKLDKENSSKSVLTFRAAVTGADDCVAQEQGSKGYRKLISELHKAMQKYNFALLHALDKAAEDFRKYIQSAYEVSQRVQDSAEIQMARFN